MKLRQLEAIRAVLARGTTTHAAETLGLTQSAVSRLISQLEDELGLDIFDRRHGRLVVTPEGQQFYAVAEKVLAGIDQITATARDIRTLQAGALRIIAMPTLSHGLLPKTIARMNQQYKQVRISLDVGFRNDLEAGISSAKYDFGLATLPIDLEGIDIEPLCSVYGVCVVPKDHELAAKEIIEAADLTDIPFISVDPRTMLRYRTDELFGGLGIKRRLGVEAQTTMMACSLVCEGVGVSIVHPFTAASFGDRLAIRPFEPNIRFEYAVMFPSGQTRSNLTNAFVDTLREDLETYGDELGLDKVHPKPALV
ncbi:MAG: LysR family transcriptional regulator [Rhodospirillales bacterium]|nr:LysR family transcriptional regulator [Rhodospirillales bacterium]